MRGTILVFSDGFEDIQTQKKKLDEFLSLDHKLFILHGNIEIDSEVFQRCSSDKRKIILATNIAETSITIDDVVSLLNFSIFYLFLRTFATEKVN